MTSVIKVYVQTLVQRGKQAEHMHTWHVHAGLLSF